MSTGLIIERPTPPRTQVPPSGDGPNDRGGGGGGGGGGRGPNQPDFGSSGPPLSVSRIGVLIIIGSIIMLFGGFLSVYVILRFSAPEWPPKGQAPLPPGLWISTAIIFASHFTFLLSQRAAASANRSGAMTWLFASLGLGVAFCVSQSLFWRHLAGIGIELQSSIYAANFYALTVMHFVHIIGGIIYMTVAARTISSSGLNPRVRERLTNCAVYWHFVGALWYILFVALYLV